MRNGHKAEPATVAWNASVMWTYKTPGIPDDLFLQSDNVPGPTKEEIRVLTVSKARLKEGFYVIDVGCGTGGLTVEAALQVGYKGRVFAIDEDEEAARLTTSNVQKFDAQDIVKVMKGKAPEALADLPKVDVVIVGGTKNLREIIPAAYAKLKKHGRIVVNAILLETASTALEEIRKAGFAEIDVTQVNVAKGKVIDSGTMMLARNPITIISATRA
jgi:cobalt-precorrin-6B (C15)-methyltransferase